jgi:hypothetical protein
MRLLKVSLLVICVLALASTAFAQTKVLASTTDQSGEAGLPIFGANASLQEWGHAWSTQIAVPFLVSKTGWKIENIGIVAFGPAYMDGGDPQSVVVRIYGTDPNTQRANTSDVITEVVLDGITTLKKYVVSVNTTLNGGKYWLSLSPADDDTRVSWVKSTSAAGQLSNLTTERVTTSDGRTSFVMAQAEACPIDAAAASSMMSVPVFEIGGTASTTTTNKVKMMRR